MSSKKLVALGTGDNTPEFDVDNETGAVGGDHDGIRKLILEIKDSVEKTSWALGEYLTKVHDESLYQGWGFQSWREYVDSELGMTIRKVQYLLSLDKWYREMTPAIQEWIRSIGWTKARVIMHGVTIENALEWKARIEGKSLSEIEDIVKGIKAGIDEDGNPAEGDASTVGNIEPTKKFKANLVGATQIGVVDAAMKRAQELTESDKDNHNLAMICTDFLATNTATIKLREYLAQIEQAMGIRVVAYNPDTDRIVYGEELIAELEGKEVSSPDENSDHKKNPWDDFKGVRSKRFKDITEAESKFMQEHTDAIYYCDDDGNRDPEGEKRVNESIQSKRDWDNNEGEFAD
jgi:hypothetical protein